MYSIHDFTPDGRRIRNEEAKNQLKVEEIAQRERLAQERINNEQRKQELQHKHDKQILETKERLKYENQFKLEEQREELKAKTQAQLELQKLEAEIELEKLKHNNQQDTITHTANIELQTEFKRQVFLDMEAKRKTNEIAHQSLANVVKEIKRKISKLSEG